MSSPMCGSSAKCSVHCTVYYVQCANLKSATCKQMCRPHLTLPVQSTYIAQCTFCAMYAQCTMYNVQILAEKCNVQPSVPASPHLACSLGCGLKATGVYPFLDSSRRPVLDQSKTFMKSESEKHHCYWSLPIPGLQSVHHFCSNFFIEK